MKILVTGATGFIGSEVLKHIGSNHELLLLGRNTPSNVSLQRHFVKADLRVPEQWEETVRQFQADACLHLAWEGLPDYSVRTSLENVRSSCLLAESVLSRGCKKIFVAGTCWEYGQTLGEKKEADSIEAPINFFASAKTGLRHMLEGLTHKYEAKLIWGRIFFAYGKGQRPSSLIPSLISRLKKGERAEIKTPYQINDFIHVADVAEAIIQLIESPEAQGIYNISTGEPRIVLEVYHEILTALGKNRPPKISMKEGKGFWGNSTKLKDETGWTPKITLSEGVKSLLTSDT